MPYRLLKSLLPTAFFNSQGSAIFRLTFREPG